MIDIVINETSHSLPAGTTLAQLIRQLAPAGGTVAAVNETFVPRSRHEGQVLQAGDRVELLAPMEGG